MSSLLCCTFGNSLRRNEGYLTPDFAIGQILMATSRAGVFRPGGTVVGTQAFREDEGVQCVRISAHQAAQTNDNDIARFERLSRARDDRVDPMLNDVFAGPDFEALPAVDGRKVWRWRQTRRQTQVAFLTASFMGEFDLRNLPAPGVSAQSLHVLTYLIAAPPTPPLLYRDGAMIEIPRAEGYAIHKLIISARCLNSDTAQKARKDRAQAAFPIRMLVWDVFRHAFFTP